MTFLAQIIAWLNGGMNALFALLRGPMTALPAWLSLTVISAVLGVVLLILFKYTSHQSAIGRVRDTIKAKLLAMKLFKDNIPVVLRSQLQVFAAAILLLIYSIPPMLVMITPFCLILGQLGAWYQARPLEVGQPATVVMQLAGDQNQPMPPVSLLSSDIAEVITGPVRVPSRQRVYWTIRPTQPGIHPLQFDIAGSQVEKELSVGSAPVSIKRPGLNIGDLILYPAEKPFAGDSIVQSIEIDYPERTAPITGSGAWIVTLFIVSMVFAFLAKPFINVKI